MKEFNSKIDDSYDEKHGPDRNHKRIDFNATDLFIDTLLDLRINHPDAYAKWAELRLKELQENLVVNEKREAELIKRKTMLNQEVEMLKAQMEKNRRES